jgi:hypothetical protein
LIDHLPRNTYYWQAVSTDEEHAEMLIRARQGQGAVDASPPLSTWSPEVGVLADLVDAVNALRHAFVAVNSKPGANPKFEPYARPRSVMEKVQAKDRARRHTELVGRVLPHKRREG